MVEELPIDDPFRELEGKDGYHVVRVEVGNVLTLSCIAYAGGTLTNLVSGDPADGSVEILELIDPTKAQRGAAIRLQLVLDAVARYLTTGGQWDALGDALATMRKVASGGLVFPGYHLIDSYSTTTGTYQHVFQKDGTDDAILWEEAEVGDSGLPVGGFIDLTTLDKILQQQESDETVWREAGEEAGEAEENLGRAPLQLPAADHDEDEGATEAGPGDGVPGDDAGR